MGAPIVVWIVNIQQSKLFWEHRCVDSVYQHIVG
jgi:hypothetical protein